MSSSHVQHSCRPSSAGAGRRVLEEVLGPRHVDEAGEAAARQRAVREAEVDRHAAGLLLGQPVGVRAGQRLDERALAVVHVAGGADDDGVGGMDDAVLASGRRRGQTALRAAG